MQNSEDHVQLKRWMPFVMEGTDAIQKVAATYMATGTDVNFGALTKALNNVSSKYERRYPASNE